jgi:N-methylhydantoinase A
MGSADWRLAVDIGGTFTDLVLLDAASGRVVVDKTLTTPSAPLEAVRHGVAALLEKAGVSPSDITAPIVHATTLITNALIEGKTGRAGLVTTDGFGDTLLIRDEHHAIAKAFVDGTPVDVVDASESHLASVEQRMVEDLI